MGEIMFLELPTIIAHNPKSPELHPSEGGTEPLEPKPATFTIGKGMFNWQAIVGASAAVSHTNGLPYTKVYLVSGPVVDIAMAFEKFHKQFSEQVQKQMDSRGRPRIELPAGSLPPGGM